MAYYHGEGVKKNPQKAVSWLKKAAKQNLLIAQASLGYIYVTDRNFKNNLAEGIFWTKKASAYGNARAQATLGIAYLIGKGVEKNIPEGVSWIKKAARQGNYPAQSMLASCYENGIGVKQNKVLAYALYLHSSPYTEVAMEERQNLEKKLSKDEIVKARSINIEKLFE